MSGTCPYSKFWVMAVVVPGVSGVLVPTEIVSVAIVEVKAKRIRHSIKMAFKFNFPPPFLFFPLRSIIYMAGKEKRYMELSNRSKIQH